MSAQRRTVQFDDAVVARAARMAPEHQRIVPRHEVIHRAGQHPAPDRQFQLRSPDNLARRITSPLLRSNIDGASTFDRARISKRNVPPNVRLWLPR